MILPFFHPRISRRNYSSFVLLVIILEAIIWSSNYMFLLLIFSNDRSIGPFPFVHLLALVKHEPNLTCLTLGFHCLLCFRYLLIASYFIFSIIISSIQYRGIIVRGSKGLVSLCYLEPTQWIQPHRIFLFFLPLNFWARQHCKAIKVDFYLQDPSLS